MNMKKIGIGIVFLVLGVRIFAFEHICSAQVKVFPNDPAWKYDFFSINLNSPVEILSLGIFIGDGTDSEGNDVFANEYFFLDPHPTQVYEDNTSLSQAVKDKMQQVGANVCMTVDSDDNIIVNILMQNGRYTTVVYY
jgi:hypothetical protein